MLQCKWHSEAFSWWPSLPGSWEQSYEISDTHAGHRLASGWKDVEGVFVGFQSIAHSPKSRADGQAFHSFPHPGSCAGYACKALFWARFEHMFVQHRTISIYFEMLVRFCSILFRSIRHIWDLWVYCTFGGIHLPSGQSARRKARLLSAKRCMALSWADDIMTWWPAKRIWSNMVLQSLNIENTYNSIHNVYPQRLTACMDAMDNRHTLKHVLWDIHMHS